MHIKILYFIFTAIVLLQIEVNGRPTQTPDPVSQLSYLLAPVPNSKTDIAAVEEAFQNASVNLVPESKQTETHFQNLFKQLPWLDEGLLWLGGVFLDRIARFIPQLIRKYIFRRDISWIDMC